MYIHVLVRTEVFVSGTSRYVFHDQRYYCCFPYFLLGFEAFMIFEYPSSLIDKYIFLWLQDAASMMKVIEVRSG